jgi:carbon-monoxide dehydrogenase large subunit
MPEGYVSSRIKRVEDPPLLKGQARYLDDLKMPGMLAVAFLRSPHAHARIVGLDVSGAVEAPGVVAVLTGAELAGLARPVMARLSAPGYRVTEWPALAAEKIRFVGEPLVAVAAVDRYRAEDAVERIRASYEPLPAVTDAERAMEAGAPRLHSDLPDNVFLHVHFDNGQFEAAAAEAELRLREKFHHPRCTGAPLEGRGVAAHLDRGDGTLTVWASSQTPHLLRSGLAEVLDLAESRIRVITPAVGGGFGTKMHMFPEDIVISLLALRLGRPVKWSEDRRENLLASAHAREQVVEIEVLAKRDGAILGLKAKLMADVGAYSIYPVTAALEPLTSAGILPGPYRIRGYAYDAYAVATNKCPTGAYRGVGMAIGTFVRERVLDIVAGRTGLDPAEIRRRNFARPGEFPFATASGLVVDSGDPGALLDRLLRESGYDDLRRERKESRHGKYRGIGLSAYSEFTGMGSGTFRRRGMVHLPGHDAATVRIEPTGEVRGFVSAVSQGQGHATAFAQVLADELGVPLPGVSVVAGDTERCPHGSGSFASRSMVASGGALILAARKVREKVVRIAAHLLEAAPEDLLIEGGHVFVRGSPSRKAALREVAKVAYALSGRALPEGVDPGLEAVQYYDPPPATFATGAHLAVVEVDAETGQVEILRYVVVEDCGRVVNPMLVEGQVHGAVAQGVGNSLYEDLAYDSEGQPLTASFMDYLLPTAMEIPGMEVVHLATLPPVTVGGFKGMAEGGTIGATATVANAVADALAPLGVSIRALPLSPDRVFRLVQAARTQ